MRRVENRSEVALDRARGALLSGWAAPPVPGGSVLLGRYARLEPLDADRHTADLFAANAEDADGVIWDYLPYGPFSSQDSYREWVLAMSGARDPFFHAVKNLATGRWCGVASYLRIKPAAGSIEVGHINYAPPLQRTLAATEAMYLMMKWAFEAGYRRYEWKCDALNLRSRRAAERLGLSYEGIFRQATVVKGRNRDTAWFAAIDKEWPALRAAYERWLSPENFDVEGRQIAALRELTRGLLAARDPAL